jgi:hypothetical protein
LPYEGRKEARGKEAGTTDVAPSHLLQGWIAELYARGRQEKEGGNET